MDSSAPAAASTRRGQVVCKRQEFLIVAQMKNLRRRGQQPDSREGRKLSRAEPRSTMHRVGDRTCGDSKHANANCKERREHRTSCARTDNYLRFAHDIMLNFRTLTRRSLPLSLKPSFQQLLLNDDSYGPWFSSAGEEMVLVRILLINRSTG